MTDEFWKNKIRAFLHDPPDKVVKIQRHEVRRNEILGRNLAFTKRGIIGSTITKSDVMASSFQRIDLEKSRDNKKLSFQFYQIHDEKHMLLGDPVLRHPITGAIKDYNGISSLLPVKNTLSDATYINSFEPFLNELVCIEKETFTGLVNYKNDKEAYFRLWRFYGEHLKDKLKKEYLDIIGDEFINLPAYTFSPDHTLFDHADATSAIFGAVMKGNYSAEPENNPALLMFKISPVQDFIANARKEKDLWAGSHLLSFLTFQALNVIVDDYGPDAIIFPHLRGQPFFGKCYEAYFNDLSSIEERKEGLKIANIPNTFLAIVDHEHIETLKDTIKHTVEGAITKMFSYAWEKTITDDVLKTRTMNFTDFTIYKTVIANYFTVTVEALPVPFQGELVLELEEKRNKEKRERERKRKSYEKLNTFLEHLDLPVEVINRYTTWLTLLRTFEASEHPANSFDLYALMFELLKEITAVESRKFEKTGGKSAFKCSLCGELEAIGGEDHAQMKRLWDTVSKNNPVLIKKNEHLCPLCLLKREYPSYITDEKGWDIDTRLESVSEVALRKTIFVNGKETKFIDVITDMGEAMNRGLLAEFKSYWANVTSILNCVVDIVFPDKEHLLCKKELFYNKELIYKENLASIDAFAKCMGFDENDRETLLKERPEVQRHIENARKAIIDMEKVLGEPEKHYAILMMDGDNMGKLLVGEDMRIVKKYLHPHLLKHVKGEIRAKAGTTKRLLTPAAHAAISRALMYFSVRYVPEIVDTNSGILIYAGGDDVLALLPVDTALKCAYEIQNEFNREWRNGWDVMPGRTMSAGLFIVHYKHPLYDALDKARALEKDAKNSGRNAIAMGYMKKSGSYRASIFAWSLLKESAFRTIYNALAGKDVSKRLIFHILDEIDCVSEPALEHYLAYECMQHLNMNQEEAMRTSKELLKLPETCLFRWEEVHRDDNGRLRRFLVDDLDLDWAKDAKMHIFDVGKTIRIFNDEDSTEITIEKEEEEEEKKKKKKAILKINDCRILDLKVKKEHGTLNIYTEKIKNKDIKNKDKTKETKPEAIKSLFNLFKILLDSDADLEGKK